MRHRNGNCRFALIAACCLAGATLAGPAHSDITYTVNSTLDEIDNNPGDGVCNTSSNVCSLRAAVMEASRISGPGTTIMLPAGLYALTLPFSSTLELGGDLDVLQPVAGNPVITLQGAGLAATIIDAGRIDRVMTIHRARTMVISDVTIRNGSTGLVGGGIDILGPGRLTMYRSEVSGNTAGSCGGGIAAQTLFGEAYLTINQTTVSNNQSSVGGGLCGGSLTILQSAIIGNDATRDGGGVWALGELVMINSTVAANTAARYGGGIYVERSTAKNVYNSTIAFNAANEDQDFDGIGGGVYVSSGPPGGIFDVYNSIIAGNTVNGTPQPDDCKGELRTHARNRFGVTTGCTLVHISGSWDYLNSLSFIGQPQNNGGRTPTIALLAGSNAINAADPVTGCYDNVGPNPLDQRGFQRNVGICDLGAYEFGSVDPNDVIFKNGFDSLALSLSVSSRRTSFGEP